MNHYCQDIKEKDYNVLKKEDSRRKQSFNMDIPTGDALESLRKKGEMGTKGKVRNFFIILKSEKLSTLIGVIKFEELNLVTGNQMGNAVEFINNELGFISTTTEFFEEKKTYAECENNHLLNEQDYLFIFFGIRKRIVSSFCSDVIISDMSEVAAYSIFLKGVF